MLAPTLVNIGSVFIQQICILPDLLPSSNIMNTDFFPVIRNVIVMFQIFNSTIRIGVGNQKEYAMTIG